MVKQNIENTQQQATAAWIDFLKFERLRELAEKLAVQDLNFENAMEQLEKLREFIGTPEHILGSSKTKHGEIAENMQVHINNAKRIVDGLKPQHTFDGVHRTAPEDYLFDGNPVQQKFYNGIRNTFDAVKKHLETYPDFIKNGGTYDIPKDQYEHIIDILNKPSSQLTKTENTIVKLIREWEEKNGISFTDKVKPTVIDYAQAQTGNAEKTISDAEKEIKSKDEKKREEITNESKPGLKEGAKVTVIAAVVEGGLQFVLAVHKKLKDGKKLTDFSKEDWQEIGITTAKGSGVGAIRGAGTYILTNYANMSGTVANGYITSTIGILNQANQFRKGDISEEDFLINSQVVCLDAAISVVGAALGQIAIPVPVLGAVIGSSVANFMSGLAKEHLSKKEQELIKKYETDIAKLVSTLNEEHRVLVKLLEEEYAKFSSLVDLAFDVDVNVAFSGSIQLAEYVGVNSSKILNTKEDIDNYFLK